MHCHKHVFKFLLRVSVACRTFKGELSPNLLSEMSLPGVEVLIEKLLPKILGRLGKENPSKRRCQVASAL